MINKKVLFIFFTLILSVSILSIAQKKVPDYTSIKLQLENINELDQKWQMKMIEFTQSEDYIPESKEAKALNDSFNNINSTNLQYVDSILQNYGWLGQKQVGRIGQNAIFLVVQHAGLSYQLSIKKIIKRAYRNGNLPPPNYALIIDRIKVLQNKKQIYGSQAKSYDGKYYIMPCKRKKTLNKRRKKMGLETIEEYIESLENLYGVKFYGIK